MAFSLLRLPSLQRAVDFTSQQIRFATKKAGGSTKNGRDSPGQRLGLKKAGGERVKAGNILIRQRGLKWRHGDNTGLGRDYTIWALTDGWVKFTFCYERRRSIVSVVSENPNKNLPSTKTKRIVNPIKS